MQNALKKITVTFILVCLIPVGFLLYEIGSLSDNEKIVNKAYHNQLEAILYSINQYTDDVFSSWAGKMDILLLKTTQISNSDSIVREKLTSEFGQLGAVFQIRFSDLEGKNFDYALTDSTISSQKVDSVMQSIMPRVKRLATYQRGGFRKIEAVDTLVGGRFIPVFFLLDQEIQQARLALLFIDQDAFLQNVMAPKMQVISKGEFVISTFSRRDNALVYSTEASHPGFVPQSTAVAKEDVQQKELWLLPGYYISITLKDASISNLVKQRSQTTMIIFACLFILLVAGILFLYYNIRKEILLSQSKSEFVSNVSHEIRTPLSLISMYAETLEMNRVPENRKAEYYSIITREAARLSSIVNRILNFAQVDANKKKFDFKRVDLNEICGRISESYETHMRETGFQFKFTSFNAPLVIMADEESVSEAIHNLIDNAVKYSQDTKRIEMRTGMSDGTALVEVEDRGIGIPKMYQRNIFEQFYRVPTNNVHNAKGTGLGLALVKRTMTAHKGRVGVTSLPGKGSTFSLTFPLLVAEQTKDVKL